MIVLDTHIWIWWVHNDVRLSPNQRTAILENENNQIGVSAISVWEIAKLVEKEKLVLPVPIEDWFKKALAYPGIFLVDLTPEIAVTSTRLPDGFHKDPADQIIIATALCLDCSLVTSDEKVINYPYVSSIS